MQGPKADEHASHKGQFLLWKVRGNSAGAPFTYAEMVPSINSAHRIAFSYLKAMRPNPQTAPTKEQQIHCHVPPLKAFAMSFLLP